MQTEDVLPNQTIYINNLNEKVKKEPLKKDLYSLFSQYGRILDVVASKSDKLRGQAWVVFEDVGAATNAMRQMQGYPFYDKPLRIQFAKTKSDAVAKIDGTFVPREKRKREEKAPAAPKPKAPATREAKKSHSQGGHEVPNSILFCEDLPAECTDTMLTMLFQQYHGFKEVRIVPGKNVAFVEFVDEIQAGIALHGLRGFKLTPTDTLRVNFAKK